MLKNLLPNVLRAFLDQKPALRFSSVKKPGQERHTFSDPELDWNYYSSVQKTHDLKSIRELSEHLRKDQDDEKRRNLVLSLLHEANQIPNRHHPDIAELGEQPKVIRTVKSVDHNFKVKEFSEFVKHLKTLRTNNISHLTGARSYYFLGDFAELEKALIRYTLKKLKGKNFKLISVPDIIPSHVIERCGMSTKGERTQVYYLDQRHVKEACLSGTAEMSIGGFIHDTEYSDDELPLLFTSVSRCYRAETSSVSEEKGIYRVHQFSKVEMFGVCTPEMSDDLLAEFLSIQEELFLDLGLDYQVLDMPKCELGAPASRKFDIEAWMPGRDVYGEISSCSNCTDYQSRRLNVKVRDKDGELKHAHTVNGTACAVPRLILAISETNQLPNGNITVPKVLQPYLKKEVIQRQKHLPTLKSSKK